MSHNKSFGLNKQSNTTTSSPQTLVCDNQRSFLRCWHWLNSRHTHKSPDTSRHSTKIIKQINQNNQQRCYRNAFGWNDKCEKIKRYSQTFPTKSTKLKKKQQNNYNCANEIKPLYWKGPDSQNPQEKLFLRKETVGPLISHKWEKKDAKINSFSVQNRCGMDSKQSKTPQKTSKNNQSLLKSQLKWREKMQPWITWKSRFIGWTSIAGSVWSTNSHLQLNREFGISLEVKQFCEQCARKTSNSFSYCPLQNNTEQTNRKIGYKLFFSNQRITFSTQHSWKLLCSWNQQRDAQTHQT